VAELTPQQAAIELLRRRRARESLLGFAEAIQIPNVPAVDDPDQLVFEPVGSSIAHHHRVFMEAIERTMLRPYGRLIIMAPPGSAKSTYGTVIGPTWYMGKFPGARIMLASYGTELAERHGRRARSVVNQQAYRDIFATSISDHTSAAREWTLNNGSEYMAGGLLAGITGNRAAGFVIDDPVKGRKEANSAVTRQSTRESYEDNVDSRLLPGAWIIMILTRWHPEDLAGTILPEDYDGASGMVACRDGRDWEVINMPAECERADDPLGRPIGDGKGGVPGSMIWPEYFDAQHWVSKRLVERTWASLYQQHPRIDTDCEFKAEWVNWYKPGEAPRWLQKYMAGDFAVTEDQKADFSELGIAGVDQFGKLWILDWWYGQVELDRSVAEAMRLADKWSVRRLFDEVGVIHRAIEPFFRLKKREIRGQSGKAYSSTLELVPLPHIGDKVAKFQAFRGMAQSGMLHVPDCDWGHRLVDLLCKFPDSRYHDDAPDVCAHFGRAVEGMQWSRPAEVDERAPDLKFGSWEWLTHGTEAKSSSDDSLRIF